MFAESPVGISLINCIPGVKYAIKLCTARSFALGRKVYRGLLNAYARFILNVLL